ncbi:hypothetical protein A2U01_0099932, partial [Trifolium medium]|nr:hypothetical protein [Trifolium medium]
GNAFGSLDQSSDREGEAAW